MSGTGGRELVQRREISCIVALEKEDASNTHAIRPDTIYDMPNDGRAKYSGERFETHQASDGATTSDDERYCMQICDEYAKALKLAVFHCNV